MPVEPWLVRAARARPQHEALCGLTYAQLLEAARTAAGGLRGVEAAAIALPPGEDFAVTLHACLLAGVVAVPVDLRLGEAERAVVTAGCDAILDARPSGAPIDPRPHALERPAIAVHTSGTSGTPKRVELTYGNWLWSALGAHTAMGLGPAERWLCALPLSHVGGLSILVRSAIYATTAIVHERFDAARVLAEEFSVISVVPTTLARLLDAAPRPFRALVGGAPIPPVLLERAAAHGVEALETYGLTEACSQVTTQGRPLFCTRVALTDEGEIVVEGPTVAPSAGPRLATGDLGAWAPDGRLLITGRKADTIVTGGENVAPAEVEAVLEAHPAVAEAAVHARPDPDWGEAVVAQVVLRAGHTASEQDLLVFTRDKLAPFKVPKALSFVSSLPRTVSGKLLRRHLE
ncbi:MAG: 2-succinylbenzoate--CoA ligase [Solirubrobacterales bacterium]|nr:2-succinylbenzoate--CoA ligase [Solirubrobacterales bacterium]